MCEPLPLVLMGIGEWDIFVGVTVAVDDHFHVADDDEITHAEFDELSKQ